MKRSIIVLFVLCRVSVGFEVGDVVKVNLEPYNVACASNVTTIKQIHKHTIELYELTQIDCYGVKAHIFAIDKHLTLFKAAPVSMEFWEKE